MNAMHAQTQAHVLLPLTRSGTLFIIPSRFGVPAAIRCEASPIVWIV